MLKIARSICDLNLREIMDVYEESLLLEAAERYGHEDANVALLNAEQDFRCYLKQVFFQTDGAFCAVWETDNKYLAALRMEPYRKGLLIAGIETKPTQRRKGYAKMLLDEVIAYLQGENNCLYSHVNIKNIASMRLHEACGFRKILDYAVYLDGSVDDKCCTLCYRECVE